jgi:hypothetical protein
MLSHTDYLCAHTILIFSFEISSFYPNNLLVDLMKATVLLYVCLHTKDMCQKAHYIIKDL